MAWEPDQNVVDLTSVIENLLGYVETNAGDALAWANDETALPSFAGLYANATGRLATKFPQLIVLDMDHVSEESDTENGEMLVTTLTLTLEVALSGPNADTLVTTTKKYAMALESMLVNIPTSSLFAGGNVIKHFPIKYRTAFDQVKGQGEKKASSWLQIFQTQVEYQLIASLF